MKNPAYHCIPKRTISYNVVVMRCVTSIPSRDTLDRQTNGAQTDKNSSSECKLNNLYKNKTTFSKPVTGQFLKGLDVQRFSGRIRYRILKYLSQERFYFFHKKKEVHKNISLLQHFLDQDRILRTILIHSYNIDCVKSL